MPTHQDETLPQRYAREHQDYLKLCGSMTSEQVADIQLQLHNSLAREQALQQRLTAADERTDVLEELLRLAREFVNNGVELGYITMPDPETPDAAHDLVPKIDAALKPAEAARCANCDRATVEQCDDAGCGFLGAGNGAPE